MSAASPSPAFADSRRETLQRLSCMAAGTECAPWLVALRYPQAEAEQIIPACAKAVAGMAAAFGQALAGLAAGNPVETVANYRVLPAYARPAFMDDAKGGAASALEDAALLLVSLDPRPFNAPMGGGATGRETETGTALHETLRDWLLRLRGEWRALAAAGCRSTILDGPAPPRKRDEASPLTLLRIAWRAFSFYESSVQSPHADTAAQDFFTRRYPLKLWPRAAANANGADCTLLQLVDEIGDWQAGPGRNHPATTRDLEALSALRSAFYGGARDCPGRSACSGQCTSRAQTDSDYIESCLKTLGL